MVYVKLPFDAYSSLCKINLHVHSLIIHFVLFFFFGKHEIALESFIPTIGFIFAFICVVSQLLALARREDQTHQRSRQTFVAISVRII